MGHIVNARGLRLGWTHNWCDHWFSELQFYPECLHSIFRVRFFLIYFFNLKIFDKQSFFYSHFEIVKYYKQFYVNIFYYDGKLEGLFDDLIFSYYIQDREYKRQTDPEDRVWLGQFVALRFIYIFFLFSDYFTKLKKPKKPIRDIKEFFKKFKGKRETLLKLIRESKGNLRKPIRDSKENLKKPIGYNKVNLRKPMYNKVKFKKPMYNKVNLRKPMYDQENLRKITRERGESLIKIIRESNENLRKPMVESKENLKKPIEEGDANLKKPMYNKVNLRKPRENRETLRKYQIKSITYKGRALLYALRKVRLSKIKYYIKNFAYRRRIRNRSNLKLLFFFTLFIFFGFLKKKKRPRTRIDRFLLRLFFFFFGYRFVFPALGHISLFLKFIFNYIAGLFKFNISFYLINNECVTARFISRYIAKKFRQNYTIRELLKPILIELVRAGHRLRKKRRYFAKFSSPYIKNLFLGGKNLNLRKNIFKNILIYVFSLYNNYSCLFFKKYNSWFSLGMLPIYIWLRANLKHVLVSVCLQYFIKRSAFVYFFSGIFNKQTSYFNKLLLSGDNSRTILNFSPKLSLGGFFNFIYEDFFLNKHLIFRMDYKLSYSVKSFLYSQKFLNRFINFNFYMYNYNLKSSVLGYNNLKERIKSKCKMDRGINGFKIHCIGRFSRKQRRSSIWFSRGKVPLSSISANIDYGFYTIPQKNSAVTIRVWLNDNRITKWFLKAI